MSSDDEEKVGGKASAFPEIRPIVPLQTEVSGLNLHPNLPDVLGGALICMVGKIKAGKSVLWNNMILSDDFFNDLFSTVVIISPTIQHDETSRFAYEKYRDSCYTQYDDAIVEAVKNIQVEKLQHKDSDTSFAIVVDDMHGEFNHGSGKKGTGLSNFATRFRHYARRHKDPCALILSSQRMKDLTPAVRTCCTNMMISSGIKNQKEIETICELYGDAYGGKKSFLSLWDKTRNVPYSFLHLYLDRTPAEAYLNFSEKLYPLGKEATADHGDK